MSASGAVFLSSSSSGAESARRKRADVSMAKPTTNSQAASATQSYLRQTAPPLHVKSKRASSRETYFLCPRSTPSGGTHWPLRWLRHSHFSYLPSNLQLPALTSFECYPIHNIY